MTVEVGVQLDGACGWDGWGDDGSTSDSVRAAASFGPIGLDTPENEVGVTPHIESKSAASRNKLRGCSLAVRGIGSGEGVVWSLRADLGDRGALLLSGGRGEAH